MCCWKESGNWIRHTLHCFFASLCDYKKNIIEKCAKNNCTMQSWKLQNMSERILQLNRRKCILTYQYKRDQCSWKVYSTNQSKYFQFKLLRLCCRLFVVCLNNLNLDLKDISGQKVIVMQPHLCYNLFKYLRKSNYWCNIAKNISIYG